MTTREVRRRAVLVILCAAMSSPALAQRASSRRCAPPDTSGDWFVRQRAWLSDVKHAWSDEEFRNSLVAAAGLMATPLTTQLGVEREADVVTASSDTTMLARLRTLAATRGSTWPTRSVVGAAGVRAVWMLAQRDTALQRTVLHRMMESGPDEALAADVAVLEDRVRLQSDRKQLYGSQLRMVAGKLVPAPIEDSAHVDMRRDAAGLPPLARAICTLR
jgi:uncharacterized protein DUF6624